MLRACAAAAPRALAVRTAVRSMSGVTKGAEGPQDIMPVGEPQPVEVMQHRTDLGVTNGQPVKQANRTVYLFKPARNAMQSGTYQTRYWMVQFPVDERWENPLMGWVSSADPMQAIDMQMRFPTKEAAVAFCNRNGWSFIESKPQERKNPLVRTYADNFKHQPKQIRFCHTK